MSGLARRWHAAATAAGATAGDAALAAVGGALLRRWGEPHRHYHTAAHLTAVLDVVDAAAGDADRPAQVHLAAWYHDAVYDPRAAGDANERASAALAAAELAALGVPAGTAAAVAALVRVTATHDPAPGDRDAALLCDADLAVLGAPPAAYRAYAEAVRREFAHVPDGAFRAGRAAVLRRLLALPRLYRLPRLHARYDEPARHNLRRELTALAG